MALARRPIIRKDLRKIEELAEARAEQIAQFIVEEIASNPATPYDEEATGKPAHLHLRNSYYVRRDPVTGDSLIKCNRRYWVYVEFGGGHGEAQPHLRPAIDLARQVFT